MKNQKILLIEDDPDDEELILQSLRNSNIGNDVDVCRDGQQALDYLFAKAEYADRAGAALPGVVLLDLNLPKLSGLQVLEQIRKNSRTEFLPEVILTSSAEDEDRLASYKLRANSFVQKPVSFEAFSEAIKHMGVYWLVFNKPLPEPL